MYFPRKGNHDDCKIFVGGLPLSTTLDQLLRYFSAYGQVTDAVIMTDKLTGKPRGFAFICFESAGSVVSVLQHHDKHHVNGKWIDVKRWQLSPAALVFCFFVILPLLLSSLLGVAVEVLLQTFFPDPDEWSPSQLKRSTRPMSSNCQEVPHGFELFHPRKEQADAAAGQPTGTAGVVYPQRY